MNSLAWKQPKILFKFSLINSILPLPRYLGSFLLRCHGVFLRVIASHTDAHTLDTETSEWLSHSPRELLLTAAFLLPFTLMTFPSLIRVTSCPLGCSGGPSFPFGLPLLLYGTTFYYRLVALATAISHLIFCIFLLLYMKLPSRILYLHGLYVFSHKTNCYVFSIAMDRFHFINL